jgi:hypothetical protein
VRALLTVPRAKFDGRGASPCSATASARARKRARQARMRSGRRSGLPASNRAPSVSAASGQPMPSSSSV